LKEQFPQHHDFQNLADDNDPKWWSEMLKGEEIEIRDFQSKLGKDFVFGLENCKTLYLDNDMYIAGVTPPTTSKYALPQDNVLYGIQCSILT
jgi:hypothetical protein